MCAHATRRTLLKGVGAGAALAVTGCSAASGRGSSELIVYTGATGQLTNNFNPFTPTSNPPARGIIYEPLMFFNQARNDDPAPQLAESYEWSDGGKRITFRLRKGVTWSDGAPFDSADVAFTFDLIRREESLNSYALPITEARATDSHTVSIGFSRPVYAELWYIAGYTFMVPEHLWSKVENPATYPNTDPVGTGAFTLKEFSTQDYVLTRNRNYWQEGKPGIQAMRYISLSGNQAATKALLAGKLDWTTLVIPRIDRTYVSRHETNDYVATPLYLTVLIANTVRGLTSDVAVRQALSLGFDRGQINDLVYNGKSEAPSPAMLLLPRDERYVAPELRGKRMRMNRQRARRILEQAGYRRGDDGIFVSRRGERLSLTLKITSGYTDYISTANVLRQQLEKIGIELIPREVSYAAFTADRNNGEFQLAIDNLYGGPDPYYLYNDFYNSANTAPIGEQANPNYARFRDDRVDEALEAVGSTRDERERERAYAEVQRVISEQLPYIPVLQRNAVTQYRTEAFTGWPTENDQYAVAAAQFAPDLGIVAKNLRVKQ
ncbi:MULTISPECIES: ABC transporter substrate-binding protein [unclassified Actinopolyspora]|uniref:ABC transporter substrate-binding protein n=1 Tax=unclassified Actinopolyspora TaxID=2639451 RepID=UPI001F605776|nr:MULTISPECIES: ABC transporter substrate-binding protein [unclassified Actinopolyspora]